MSKNPGKPTVKCDQRLFQSTPSASHKVKLYLRKHSLCWKFSGSVPAGCCLAQDCQPPMKKMNPALLSLDHLFFFFFTHPSRWWNTHTYIRWHSHRSPSHPHPLRSQLASSLYFFLNFSPPLPLIHRPLPHTPTVKTSKQKLLLRHYPRPQGNSSCSKLPKNTS